MDTTTVLVDLITRGLVDAGSPLAVISGKLADGTPLTPQDEKMLKGTLPPLVDRLEEELWKSDAGRN